MTTSNFVCVYRTGKVYNFEYVKRLAAMIEEHFPWPHNFIVLTDVPGSPEAVDWLQSRCHPEQTRRAVRLGVDWPNYWSKINLFNFASIVFPGEVVTYFDLDTIITRQMWWAYSNNTINSGMFITLRDWLEPSYMNSSIMIWRGGEHWWIYNNFFGNADDVMRRFKKYPEAWGDQGWIEQCLALHGVKPTYLQDLFPNHFVSFKANTCEERKAAHVVCFHGNPRPHVVDWDPFTPFP